MPYSKFKFASCEKFTDAKLSDILQFLKIKVFKDVILLMNTSEELPLTMSPILKLVSWTRLDRVVGSGP